MWTRPKKVREIGEKEKRDVGERAQERRVVRDTSENRTRTFGRKKKNTERRPGPENHRPKEKKSWPAKKEAASGLLAAGKGELTHLALKRKKTYRSN